MRVGRWAVNQRFGYGRHQSGKPTVDLEAEMRSRGMLFEVINWDIDPARLDREK
jgi:hypothetical protein